MAIAYWVGSSNHGHIGSPQNMLKEFIQQNYWATDLNLKKRDNKHILASLQSIKVNDRFSVSSLRNRYQEVDVKVIGTVTNVDDAENGRLEIKWDAEQPLYSGLIPLGTKNENWHQVLFKVTTAENITLIFPDSIVNKKVARLAWNDEGWTKPSGVKGKASSNDTLEGKFGFGLEEWLFDVSKVVDGYHYGFLEPIRKGQASQANKSYPIWLYTINGSTKKRYWIAEIKKTIVIDEAEATFVKQKYQELGWLKEMQKQISSVGSKGEDLAGYAAVDLFNVKFKPEDLIINQEVKELSDTHPANKVTKYSFANFTEAFIVE
ncbi:hypothetical protein [Dyadobacter sp. 3J3]|uniref:hypothetical protein n=1 Tax=Dyadobacter sp. 3J3 TaxID=2606600 RepID=UPI00135840B7|nr:hypothetical protein [Dyadobacter sp. 3J3]